ncbi:hypothetical protein IKF15_01815 [Candidatus Saccharibacteria bacterium]|nr:hypothetical protein [Candidatus Saccharibacteria bacterium]
MKSEKLKKIKKLIVENKLETLVAVFLGITTLLVAWAGWIGSLHGGIQAINFTKSNNLAAQGNAEYNVAAQVYISDLFSWNTVLSLRLDLEAARTKGDHDEAQIIETKIQKIKEDSCSPRLAEAMDEPRYRDGGASPFEDENFTNGYFEEAKKLLDESQQTMEEGKTDNLRGDSYRLVSVIYSLVLFLLGTVGVLKDYQSRKMLFIFSACILGFGIIYMLTIPMPTGFDITNFFKLK